MNYGKEIAQDQNAPLFDEAITYENEEKKDLKKSELIQLLNNGQSDREVLRKKIQQIKLERLKCDKRKETLRLDLAIRKKEIQTIAKNKDKVLNYLTDEIRSLRILKQTMKEYYQKMPALKFSKPSIIESERHRGASNSVSPQGVKKDGEQDLCQHSHEINRFRTDPCIHARENETIQYNLNPIVRKPRSRTFTIPNTDAVFSKQTKDAVRTFVYFLHKLEPKVLRALWANYVEANEKESGGVLFVINLPIFLDNLVLFIFKQENPRLALPSRRKTKPLVSFIQFILDPYIGKKRYITRDHFMLFPQWLRETMRKTGVCHSCKKVVESMKHEEEYLRQQLTVGDACNIWSTSNKKWCQGEVTRTKCDDSGEWLLITYICKNKVISKDVQRFSNLLDISGQVLRRASSHSKDYLETRDV